MHEAVSKYFFSFSRSRPTTDAVMRTADTPICLVKLFLFRREVIGCDHRGPSMLRLRRRLLFPCPSSSSGSGSGPCLSLKSGRRSIVLSPEVRASVGRVCRPLKQILTPAQHAYAHRLGLQDVPQNIFRQALAHPKLPHSEKYSSEFENLRLTGITHF